MEGNRRLQHPSSPVLAAMEHSAPGGHSVGRRGTISPSPPQARPGISRSFRLLFTILAGLSMLTLAFVSGIYRPPLPLLAGIYRDSASWRQPRNSENGQFTSLLSSCPNLDDYFTRSDHQVRNWICMKLRQELGCLSPSRFCSEIRLSILPLWYLHDSGNQSSASAT